MALIETFDPEYFPNGLPRTDSHRPVHIRGVIARVMGRSYVPRSVLEALANDAIEAAAFALSDEIIRVLDRADGDPDLEPCEAGDDGLHYFRNGYTEGWGYDWSDDLGAPVYGEDQSEGPLSQLGRPYTGYHTVAWRG